MTNLDERVAATAGAAQEALHALPLAMIEYPWTELEARLVASGQPLRLLGFGSLLNPESARRTIRDTPPEGHPPVLAYGARRVFNYRMPPEVIARYGADPQSRELAALNTRCTGRVEDVLTGRLVTVSPVDIGALRDREIGYGLHPVVCFPWDAAADRPLIAYALCAVDSAIVDNDLLPFPPYVEVCRAGARLVDDAFEHAFLETSWLGGERLTLHAYLA